MSLQLSVVSVTSSIRYELKLITFFSTPNSTSRIMSVCFSISWSSSTKNPEPREIWSNKCKQAKSYQTVKFLWLIVTNSFKWETFAFDASDFVVFLFSMSSLNQTIHFIFIPDNQEAKLNRFSTKEKIMKSFLI